MEEGNPVYDSRDNCNAIIETATNTLITGCKNTVIPSSVTSIGGSAFGGCSLTSICIPSIGDGAFYNCASLISIAVEEGNPVYDSRDNCNAIIETATNSLITGCKNTVIPSSVTSIGRLAFGGCSRTSISIPCSVTSIGYGAFHGCSDLTFITIPESVTSIGSSAFYECGSLTYITIPKSVTSIGNFAFAACSKLTDFYCFAEDVLSLDNTAFLSTDISSATLHVPAVSLQQYQTTATWRGFGTIVALTDKDIEDAIGDVNASKATTEIAYYDGQGRKIGKPQKGINIIRYSDGCTRKVLIK